MEKVEHEKEKTEKPAEGKNLKDAGFSVSDGYKFGLGFSLAFLTVWLIIFTLAFTITYGLKALDINL